MMKKLIHMNYNRYIKNVDIFALLGTKMCGMTEEQQIEEILLEANAYGLRNEVEQAAQLSLWGFTRLDKYQDAYLQIIYGIE